MNALSSFIQGFLAPFSPMPPFFPDDERSEPHETIVKEIQMPQYGENIRGYWTNLGNYMIDVANGHERKPSDS
jgi:hypothetical protein